MAHLIRRTLSTKSYCISPQEASTREQWPLEKENDEREMSYLIYASSFTEKLESLFTSKDRGHELVGLALARRWQAGACLNGGESDGASETRGSCQPLSNAAVNRKEKIRPLCMEAKARKDPDGFRSDISG